MDTYLSKHQNRANNFEAASILVIGDTESARARARATVTMAGFRAVDAVPLSRAIDRLERQGSAAALWLEIEEAGTGATLVLDQIAADVAAGRYPAIVAVQKEGLEAVEAHAFDLSIDIIVGAQEYERATALALATSAGRWMSGIGEATADKNAARLRQLSEEVSRIAATLARLSTGPSASSRPLGAEIRADAPEVSIETVRAVIRARRLRSRYFPEDMFADPAWDMLLDLLQAEISELRVPVSSLCIAAAVPATTALRWLKTMVQEGIFLRHADPHDGRRVFVELAPATSQALRRYFTDVGQVAVI
jgi:CheY-like chemotaxis protein